MEIAFVVEKFVLIIVIFLISLTVAAYSTLAERKIAGYLQDRVGPNRAGWGGDVSTAGRRIKDVHEGGNHSDRL